MKALRLSKLKSAAIFAILVIATAACNGSAQLPQLPAGANPLRVNGASASAPTSVPSFSNDGSVKKSGPVGASSLSVFGALEITGTETFEPTESPEVTTTATITGTAEPTDLPEATEVPSATQVSEPTDVPEATRLPDATQSPEPTDAPEATHAPEPTHVPEPTDVPEATHAPEPTHMPEPTDVPEATHAPEPTETSGLPQTSFQGTVSAINGNLWTTGGLNITVDSQTTLVGIIGVGSSVKVDVFIQPDGSLLANKIQVD